MRKLALQFGVASALLFATLLTGAIHEANAKPKVQTAKVRITERGYEPVALKLRRGIPARVTFVRTTDATCAKEIVLPDFNIRRALPLNQPVLVNFTPNTRGTFTFVCGMNMRSGQLIVQ
jgi:plastocyanin domain-containing protein